MITIALPALVALVGVLVYALTAHKSLGLIAFGCGLAGVVYLLVSHTVHLV